MKQFFACASSSLLSVSMTASLAVCMPALNALADAEPEELPAYTLEEVGNHDNAASCWIVVEGQIYDITSFINVHPAPPSVLLPWCGREATEGMRTKGYGQEHSPAAWSMLEQYLIGLLRQ